MKIRAGLVSNSSGASFSVPLSVLTAFQVEAIKRHIEYAREFLRRRLWDECDVWWEDYVEWCEKDGKEPNRDEFNAEETEGWCWGRDNFRVTGDGVLKAYVTMDNLGMLSFLREIGVPMEHVVFKGQDGYVSFREDPDFGDGKEWTPFYGCDNPGYEERL